MTEGAALELGHRGLGAGGGVAGSAEHEPPLRAQAHRPTQQVPHRERVGLEHPRESEGAGDSPP